MSNKRKRTLRGFIDFLKKCRDQLESKKLKTKEKIGKSCSWHLDTKYLNKNSIIISGGAGNDISFELELIEKFNCKVYLFDPSPTGIKTVKNYNDIENLIFIPKALTGSSGSINFSPPDIIEEGSYRVSRGDLNIETFESTTISDFCLENKISEIDVLKIDIEGFEYEVLEDVLENNKLRVSQILVEFHHFFKEIPKSKTKVIMNKLRRAGFKKTHRREVDYSYSIH
ncbi:FkbM family methyltransferase [Flavobacteriaceae bacterium]|nr:FkbM family methyltransferase [Flavobacteriaceae bacterium]